jgi:hypothetical protein
MREILLSDRQQCKVLPRVSSGGKPTKNQREIQETRQGVISSNIKNIETTLMIECGLFIRLEELIMHTIVKIGGKINNPKYHEIVIQSFHDIDSLPTDPSVICFGSIAYEVAMGRTWMLVQNTPEDGNGDAPPIDDTLVWRRAWNGR